MKESKEGKISKDKNVNSLSCEKSRLASLNCSKDKKQLEMVVMDLKICLEVRAACHDNYIINLSYDMWA